MSPYIVLVLISLLSSYYCTFGSAAIGPDREAKGKKFKKSLHHTKVWLIQICEGVSSPQPYMRVA